MTGCESDCAGGWVAAGCFGFWALTSLPASCRETMMAKCANLRTKLFHFMLVLGRTFATERNQLFQIDLYQSGDKRLTIMATSVVADAFAGSLVGFSSFSGRTRALDVRDLRPYFSSIRTRSHGLRAIF